MTQRTHDLAAVTLVSLRFLSVPPELMSWESLIGIGAAAIIGGLIPDIDNASSQAWKHKLTPWDGKITREFLKGHRHLSHSLLGAILFTLALGLLLQLVPLPDVDSYLIQEAFFLGQLSHLLADSITIEGVPWFYPIPLRFGFPPISQLRMGSGGWVEKGLVFPALLIFLIWMYYHYRLNISMIIRGIFI